MNGVRHTETVPWQLHLKKVLDCFGGLWRWMSLDGSGQLWTAALHKQFQFVLASYGRFWAGLRRSLGGSGLFWKALGSSGVGSGLFWACLGSSGGALGGPWQGFGRHWTGPWKQVWSGSGRLGTVLTGSEEVWTVLHGSGRLWTAWKALDGSLELARSLPKIENHGPTSGGEHILSSQCFASPKRVRSRKS